MIKLTDKYILDSDKFNFIVKIKTEKGKYREVAYCGNLKQVKNWIMENEIKADLTLLENIDKVIEMSNTLDGKVKC